MKVFLALLIVIGMGQDENYTYTTGGVQVAKQFISIKNVDNDTNTTTYTNTITYLFNDSKLNIQPSCRQVRVYDPALNSKVDPAQYYFLMKLTCKDIIRAKDYYEAEKNGNSTIKDETGLSQDTLIKYQCVMNVTFDGSDYCCCPDRNYDLKLKMLRWLLQLLYLY